MNARKWANTSPWIGSHSRGPVKDWASRWEEEKDAREEANAGRLPPVNAPSSPATALMGEVRELAQIAANGVPPEPLRAVRTLSPEQSCFLEILTRLEKSGLLSTMREALIEKKSIFAYEIGAMIRQTIEKKLDMNTLTSLDFLTAAEWATWKCFLELEKEGTDNYRMNSLVTEAQPAMSPQEIALLQDSSAHLVMKQITRALSEIWHYREWVQQWHVEHLRERLDSILEVLEIAHRTLCQAYTHALNDRVSDAARQMLYTVIEESYVPLSIENRKALRRSSTL